MKTLLIIFVLCFAFLNPAGVHAGDTVRISYNWAGCGEQSFSGFRDVAVNGDPAFWPAAIPYVSEIEFSEAIEGKTFRSRATQKDTMMSFAVIPIDSGRTYSITAHAKLQVVQEWLGRDTGKAVPGEREEIKSVVMVEKYTGEIGRMAKAVGPEGACQLQLFLSHPST